MPNNHCVLTTVSLASKGGYAPYCRNPAAAPSAGRGRGRGRGRWGGRSRDRWGTPNSANGSGGAPCSSNGIGGGRGNVNGGSTPSGGGGGGGGRSVASAGGDANYMVGAKLVGRRVEVHWVMEDEHYSGTVVSYDAVEVRNPPSAIKTQQRTLRPLVAPAALAARWVPDDESTCFRNRCFLRCSEGLQQPIE